MQHIAVEDEDISYVQGVCLQLHHQAQCAVPSASKIELRVCGVVCVVWCVWCGVCGVVCVVWSVWCGVCGVVCVVFTCVCVCVCKCV